jgi:hypothetical protein
MPRILAIILKGTIAAGTVVLLHRWRKARLITDDQDAESTSATSWIRGGIPLMMLRSDEQWLVRNRPLCASIIDRQSPKPPGFVV